MKTRSTNATGVAAHCNIMCQWNEPKRPKEHGQQRSVQIQFPVRPTHDTLSRILCLHPIAAVVYKLRILLRRNGIRIYILQDGCIKRLTSVKFIFSLENILYHISWTPLAFACNTKSFM